MSGYAGQSDVDRIRDATDLVHLIGEHISLRPKGREHIGLCPFHDDHKPSFAVVTHKGNAFYKCHSCGAGGDAFDFVRNYHKLDFPEALRYLADRAGITLSPRGRDQASGAHSAEGPSRADLRQANALAAEFFRRVLKSDSAGNVGRQILEARGIRVETAEEFMVGLAPDQWDALFNVVRKRNLSEELFVQAGLLKRRQATPGPESRDSLGRGAYDAFRNRLIFPICNELGQPVAFGARKINPEDEPKYLNSAESAIFQKSRTLYGLHLAKRAIIDTGTAVITEGYTDVIACHQAGLRNVVGTLGTALTKDHAEILSRLCETVVLLFDGDEAGIRAADRGIEVFFAQPVDVRICSLPDGVDPDDLLRNEGGADRLRRLIAGATDALELKVNRFRATLDATKGVSARQKVFESFLAELGQLGFANVQGVRKRLVLTHLADLLGMPIQQIERAMPRPRPSVASRADDPGQNIDLAIEKEPESHIPPARRRAEHDVLAMLLFDASLARESIQTATGSLGRVTELLSAADFLDDGAQRIAQRLFAWIDAEEHFTMQRLLGSLDAHHAKVLASGLYFDGERRLGETKAALDELRAAIEVLQSHIERAVYHRRVADFQQSCRVHGSDLPDATNLLQTASELIEQRRRQATIATAIGRGIRS